MNLEEYIRPYNKLLNIILQKKFKWFEKIELDDLKYGGVRGQQNFINPVGKIYVDSKWGYRQWREYHYESPFPYGEELSFGDIIGGDLSKEIQEQFKLCFSVVSGEITPKYMSFSWLTIVLVDKEEDTMKESIIRIIREETEPNKVNLVKKMIHKLYNNVSFIEQSTFNGKPHLTIYFNSDDTAANIESWFDEKIYRDINELTSGIITACPDWAARWDSRREEADVYINTELLRYDNLGNVINESDPKVGTGKKPKGSGRRLYTDENPSDTVSVKFKTKQDIIDTLNKQSFKSKPHKRQSQIINLIHQRVRAAYQNSKNPETKKRLKTALDYIEIQKEKSKQKTIRLQKK